MKKTVFIFILLCMAVLAGAQTGREIMEKCNAVDSSVSARTLVLMELVDKNGSVSSRQVEQLSLDQDGDSYSMIIFHSPANVKDTRFLTSKHEDGAKDQWIYLPALKKVRRIASGEGNSSFMGTDFSYNDIAGNNIDDYTYENLGEEQLGAYSCWKIRSTPAAGTDSQYRYVVSLVDKNSFLIMKQDFYNDREEIEKTLETDKIARVQDIWTRIKFRMTNNQNGHSTMLEIKKLVYDSDINIRVFSTNFLETGRL
ncbi:MAG: outer membrane lipoprotein-sorting protein [Spirochaetales bacterium]|nr:outer membrane lipoprotein-sorting protein [Spirochaetales bacterium]